MATATSRLGRPLAQAAAAVETTRTGQVIMAFALIVPTLVPLAVILPTQVATVVMLVLLGPWFAQNPIRTLYFLLGAVCLIELFPLGYQDSITDQVFFFLNLSRNQGMEWLSISPAEIIMVLGGILALSKASTVEGIRRPGGPLLKAFLLYMGVVAMGAVHGLLSGGDFKLMLWEIRPQVQAFVVFLLAASMVRDRFQIQRMAIILILAELVKAVIGVVRYFVTLQGHLGTAEQVLAHEDSYFLALYLLLAVVGVIWWYRRRRLLPVLLGSPLIVTALLANSRRAGLIALVAALVVVVVLGIRFEIRVRRRLIVVATMAVIAATIFIAASWNNPTGIRGQLVRPIKAVIQPDQRDTLSDAYRTAENANLRFSFKTSPVIGMGFGMPFYTPYPMANIAYIYPLWNVIPHNTILWIGTRMGILGFITFFGLIGLAILQGCRVLASGRDPFLHATAAFAVGAIVAELVMAYTDLQLENYRNMILLGLVLGILARLPSIADETAPGPDPEMTPPQREQLRAATRPRLIARPAR